MKVMTQKRPSKTRTAYRQDGAENLFQILLLSLRNRESKKLLVARAMSGAWSRREPLRPWSARGCARVLARRSGGNRQDKYSSSRTQKHVAVPLNLIEYFTNTPLYKSSIILHTIF